VASISRLLSPLLAITLLCAAAAPAFARNGDDAGTSRFLVRFRTEASGPRNAQARQHVLDAAGRGAGVHLSHARRLAVGTDLVIADRPLDAAATQALLLRLAHDPGVASVGVDRRVTRTMTPNDPRFGEQWHYTEATAGIRADVAWNTANGAGVVVAVIDTGITAHPDLDANIVAGYDFISDTFTANDGDGRDANASDPGDATVDGECNWYAEPSSFHGTHVAGTIAAVTNNGIGVAGVAYGARVQPVRVLGKCGGWMSDVIDAIVWASGGSVPGVPANATPAEVINLSLGTGALRDGCEVALQAAIDAAVANGAVVVAAAGNGDRDAGASAPASCRNVVTVGAVTRAGARSFYSNYGAVLDVSAPGDGILSTVNLGTTVPGAAGYGLLDGTSMATPHVSGIAALMQGKKATAPSLVETILRGTARPYPVPCASCGKGIADAANAVNLLSAPFLYVEAGPAVLEGNSGNKTLTFTVRLSQALAAPVTFTFATVDGTAVAGSDYVVNGPSAQSIPAGSLSKTFNVSIKGDTVTEGDETVLGRVTNVSGIAAKLTEAIGTIVDDEAIFLTNGQWTSLQGTKGSDTLYAINVPPGAANLYFETKWGTGELDMYVAANTSPTQRVDCQFTNAAAGGYCSFPAPAAGTYYVRMHGYDSYNAVNFVAGYDEPNVPWLSVSDATVVEGHSGTKTVDFTVTMNWDSQDPITFDLKTADATATAGSDYVALDVVGATMAPHTMSKTFSVTINGDTAVEANEVFMVNLSNPVGALIEDGQGGVRILNDDGPTLSIADAPSVAEGNAGTKLLTYTVSLSQATDVPVTYTASTAAFSASPGDDFVTKTLANETIPAGQLSRTFTVVVNGDTATEANEVMLVNLSAVTGVSLLDAQATGTILNDDGPRLTIADATITEGNSGTKLLTFTVQLNAPAPGTVTYNITTTNGSAIGGSDYVPKALTGETITQGYSSRTFQVAINGDTAKEFNETFGVVVTSATGVSILDGQANGIVFNDDGPTLSIGDLATTEGNSGTKTVTYTVSLSQAATVPVTYNIATANGPGATGAQAGTDYVAKSLVGETIPAGMLSKTFTVTLNGDTTVEPNELVYVNLSNASGATLLDSQANVFVVNDDGPTLSIADVAVYEGQAGERALTFTVLLSQAAAVPVYFGVATAPGTAAADVDYASFNANGLSIPAGMLSKTVSIWLYPDAVKEANETFTLSLTAASGATIADATALGTILNDD
jgi:serine protease